MSVCYLQDQLRLICLGNQRQVIYITVIRLAWSKGVFHQILSAKEEGIEELTNMLIVVLSIFEGKGDAISSIHHYAFKGKAQRTASSKRRTYVLS